MTKPVIKRLAAASGIAASASKVTAASSTENAAMFIRRVFRNKGLNIAIAGPVRDGEDSIGFKLNPDQIVGFNGAAGEFTLNGGRVSVQLNGLPAVFNQMSKSDFGYADSRDVNDIFNYGTSKTSIPESTLLSAVANLKSFIVYQKKIWKELDAMFMPTDKHDKQSRYEFFEYQKGYFAVLTALINGLNALARSEAKRV